MDFYRPDDPLQDPNSIHFKANQCQTDAACDRLSSGM